MNKKIWTNIYKKLESLAYRLRDLDSLRQLFAELNFEFDNKPVNKEQWSQDQKKIIQEQNEQIQRLASIASQNTTNNTYTEQTKLPEKKAKKSKTKINPYLELRIGENYDESTLKKAYLTRAMETHPDRGGSKEEFQKVTACYKALMIKHSLSRECH